MARYQVDIEKFLGIEHWTNVYHCEVPTLGDAIAFGNDVAAREKAVTRGNVGFLQHRVRLANVPGAQGTITAIGGTGSLPSLTDVLPLFCVMRVDFRTAIGRPSRKYLRRPLQPGDVSGNGGLLATTASGINTAYTSPMLADIRFVDVDGQAFTSGSVHTLIGMRQLRRGSKRRVPIT